MEVLIEDIFDGVSEEQAQIILYLFLKEIERH